MIYVILNQSGRQKEEVKHLYKTSVAYGREEEPKIWEEAMLKSKKVQPYYESFLNKLLETEIEPTPETMAIIWKDWKEKYKVRQEQDRSRGLIRVNTQLQHPSLRKDKKGLKHFFDRFSDALSMYKDNMAEK